MNEMKSGPGWLGKIKNFLGNTFNLFALGGANGGVAVRKKGGVGEIQISHDGTNLILYNPTNDSYTVLTNLNGTPGLSVGAKPGYTSIDLNGGTGFLKFGIYGNIGWTSDSTGVAADAAMSRAAAGVVRMTDNNGNKLSWLQNTGGRAVTTADVAESAAVLTSITGLSRDFKAGRKYTGQVVLKCVNSVAADGIQLDFNGGTATMTSFWAAAGVLASNGTDTVGANISTSLAGIINFTVLTGETEILVNFSCVCNAGGTFIVRVAENTHTTGTLTLRLGSSIWAEDMP